MKSSTWDAPLLVAHRRYIKSAPVQEAFDTLIAFAIALPGFQCAPAMQGAVRIFAYNDATSRRRPFAFIVNRNHLLFYVRKAGLSRVQGGVGALEREFEDVSENAAGELTVPIRTEEQAQRLHRRLFYPKPPVAATKRGIPDGITRDDVLRAIAQLDAGVVHGFGESRKFDLVYKRRPYAPNAVIGLAAERLAGRVLGPADFSGGKDSKSTTTLTDLKFVVRANRESSADESTARWRANPAEAGAVFESIIGALPAASRALAIVALRHSIQYAKNNDPDRWILTLHPNYVRFISGMVMCLQFRKDGHASILLWGEATPKALRRGAGEYATAPGCLEAHISVQDLVTQYAQLREGHERAIRICAAKRPVIRGHRQAHSPGLVGYLDSLPGSLVNESEATLDGRLFGEEMAMELAVLQSDLSETDKEAIIKARRGQGLFKQRVAHLEGRCRITGVDRIDHLRASHIKPWRFSDNVERLAGDNGLLLAPHVDHLFDGGYISFTDEGDILVSPQCPSAVMAAWGIAKNLNVGAFRDGQRPFLAYHRSEVYRKENAK